MIALPLLLMLGQVVPPPVVVATTSATPQIDWEGLPELPYRQRLPDMRPLSAFVAAEVKAGRCVIAADTHTLRVELAVYVDARGMVRRVLPMAINCPTVEQYAAGLASRFARGNMDRAAVPPARWFKTAMVFTWIP